jgi:hypothetical protein
VLGVPPSFLVRGDALFGGLFERQRLSLGGARAQPLLPGFSPRGERINAVEELLPPLACLVPRLGKAAGVQRAKASLVPLAILLVAKRP